MNKTDLILNTIIFKNQLDQGVQQEELIDLVSSLGIKKVEIRREFIGNIASQLPKIRKKADDYQISLFYSINEDFVLGNSLNPKLEDFCQEAQILGAPFIKLNTGNAREITKETLQNVNKLDLKDRAIKLENNQSKENGILDNCYLMMKKMQEAQLDISFAFDTANWIWVSDSVEDAVKKMNHLTTYLHLKNYDVTNDGLKTTGLFSGELDMIKLLKEFHYIEQIAFEYPCSSIHSLKSDIEQFIQSYNDLQEE
ncbi:sugar phosphate isomerase/epimerase family protein [Enterococcus faecalis]|uniref:sugar phosphate isomerase/epimerase family protein n=1 Tax=Enterococcus faecalis TaxID=1351 RepID=UPI00045B9BEA|nr:hypothetical protein [Enterococcus faecalis]KAJ86833.1 hypothetical protein P791_0123 [Enterococcus faecalis NY9]